MSAMTDAPPDADRPRDQLPVVTRVTPLVSVADDTPIVLVGMMGSGKSSVGRRLGKRLDRPFVDSDREVEAREGISVAEQFARDGEEAFRARETATIAALLDQRPAAVIATGGGAVTTGATRDALRAHGFVIWLRASPGALAARVKADGSRPLLADDPRGTIFRLVAEREPLYREVADVIVDVDHVKRRLVAECIESVVRGDPA